MRMIGYIQEISNPDIEGEFQHALFEMNFRNKKPNGIGSQIIVWLTTNRRSS